MDTFAPAIPFGGGDQDGEWQSSSVREPEAMLKAPGGQRLSDVNLIVLQWTNEDWVVSVACQMRDAERLMAEFRMNPEEIRLVTLAE